MGARAGADWGEQDALGYLGCWEMVMSGLQSKLYYHNSPHGTFPQSLSLSLSLSLSPAEGGRGITRRERGREKGGRKGAGEDDILLRLFVGTGMFYSLMFFLAALASAFT